MCLSQAQNFTLSLRPRTPPFSWESEDSQLFLSLAEGDLEMRLTGSSSTSSRRPAVIMTKKDGTTINELLEKSLDDRGNSKTERRLRRSSGSSSLKKFYVSWIVSPSEVNYYVI